MPGSSQARADLVKEIGSDILFLLEAIGKSEMNDLTLAPELQSLHQVWSQNFELQAGEAQWRQPGCFSCI